MATLQQSPRKLRMWRSVKVASRPIPHLKMRGVSLFNWPTWLGGMAVIIALTVLFLDRNQDASLRGDLMAAEV